MKRKKKKKGKKFKKGGKDENALDHPENQTIL